MQDKINWCSYDRKVINKECPKCRYYKELDGFVFNFIFTLNDILDTTLFK